MEIRSISGSIPDAPTSSRVTWPAQVKLLLSFMQLKWKPKSSISSLWPFETLWDIDYLYYKFSSVFSGISKIVFFISTCYF